MLKFKKCVIFFAILALLLPFVPSCTESGDNGDGDATAAIVTNGTQAAELENSGDENNVSGISLADVPTPTVVFEFDKDWESMFATNYGSGYDIYYDEAEESVAIASKADANPFTYVDFPLISEKKIKYGDGIEWGVICFKNTYSDFIRKSPNPGAVFLEVGLYNVANSWQLLRIFGEDDEFGTYVVEGMQAYGDPFEDDDEITHFRIIPCGIVPDEENSSSFHIKYVAYFATQEEALAYAAAREGPKRANNTNARGETSEMDYAMSVVSFCEKPIIDETHPDSFDNEGGYENGHVIKIGGTYHMVITELFKIDTSLDPWGSIPARIGYWTSEDADNWTRVCTIAQGSGIPGDPKNNTWSPSWFWNEAENRWNVLIRGSVQYRYRSDVEGPGGMAGPYTEVSVIGPPFAGIGREWDGFSSFGNIYTAKDGKYYSFYGAGVDSTDKRWLNALVSADNIDGPWKRVATENNQPTFVWSENPYVNMYENPKGDPIYFAVYDLLLNHHSMGWGFSADGINWEPRALDLTGFVEQWVEDPPIYCNWIRTPCGIIREEDGTYTIIITAVKKRGSQYKSGQYFSVGRLNVRIDEVPRKSDEYVVLPGDMGDWQAVRGDFNEIYMGDYCLYPKSSGDFNSVYTKQTYGDVTVSANLHFVVEPGETMDKTAKAGIHVRKANIDDTAEQSGYHVYVTNAGTIELWAAGEMIAECEAGFAGIYKTLTVSVKGDNIKVYYDNDPEPCIDIDDDKFLGAGYVGLDAHRQHWHFERVEIRE